MKMTVMNYQMSSCREPAILTFSPFQDHPHPPIGNILEKAFNNNDNKTKLKGEPTAYLLFWSNIVQIRCRSLIMTIVHEPNP